MKKNYFLLTILMLITFSSVLFSQNTAKVLEDRDNIITKYNATKIDNFIPANEKFHNLLMLHDSIYAYDEVIIEALLLLQEEYKNMLNSKENLEKFKTELSAELLLKNQLIEWGIYGAGGLLLLLLIFIILFIVKALSVGKLKKQLKSLNVLHKEYQKKLEELDDSEDIKTKIKEAEVAYNMVIDENKKHYENEKINLNKQIADSKAEISTLQLKIFSLEQDNKKLKESTENTDTKLSQEQNQEIKNLKTTLYLKEHEIKTLNTKIEKLNEDMQKLQSEEKDTNYASNENQITDIENKYNEKEAELLKQNKQNMLRANDEINSLHNKIDEKDKLITNLNRNIELLQRDIEHLKSNNAAVDKSSESRENTYNNDDNRDLLQEVNSLKLQVGEYKKILDEELLFRKDILKLIEDLKKQ